MESHRAGVQADEPSAVVTAQLRELLPGGRFREALEVAQARLREAPADRDALLGAATAQRCLGRVPEALSTLATLQQHHPRFSRLFEERGRCHVDLRQAPQAIEAFLAAVNFNHALPGSWGMLEGLYRMQGQAANAAMAASHVATLRALPREVVTATSLFQDGELEAAEGLIRRYLLTHGDHIEAMRLLARIGIAHKVYFDAQVLLGAVLERAPDYRAARHEYAFALLKLQRYAEARREYEALLRQEPGSVSLKTFHAASLAGLGEHAGSIEAFRALLDGRPEDADLHLAIGHAQKTLGDTAAAIDSYRAAARCRADFGDAYWSLANLKTYRFSDDETEAMRIALAAPRIAAEDRYHLDFARGKALEDRGDYAGSFQHYQQGNDLKRRECRYRPELIERNTRRQIALFTPEFLAARRGWGDFSTDPIFIVGLPRAGSTLLEQILASHSQVEGTQELPTVQQIVSRMMGFGAELDEPRYPQVLATLDAADFARLGREYLEGARAYRSGKRYFIDKMPNNFRHLGLIHLMLPNAKIIDARREPLACCFSNFKQLFATGQEFTYSLEDIGRYYRTYLELMAHWQQVLPGRILRVQHEDVVADLAGSVRRLLEFCGLPFEPQCLAFHENRRSVRTASSEQVRRGISREGLDQWRHFEAWLGPLREALGEAASTYRDA
ncbi:MAG: sulfotransferase [Proteobacteria bacterium]|nr:sulfotransferase [Pseudomonadota bacterium]